MHSDANAGRLCAHKGCGAPPVGRGQLCAQHLNEKLVDERTLREQARSAGDGNWAAWTGTLGRPPRSTEAMHASSPTAPGEGSAPAWAGHPMLNTVVGELSRLLQPHAPTPDLATAPPEKNLTMPDATPNPSSPAASLESLATDLWDRVNHSISEWSSSANAEGFATLQFAFGASSRRLTRTLVKKAASGLRARLLPKPRTAKTLTAMRLLGITANRLKRIKATGLSKLPDCGVVLVTSTDAGAPWTGVAVVAALAQAPAARSPYLSWEPAALLPAFVRDKLGLISADDHHKAHQLLTAGHDVIVVGTASPRPTAESMITALGDQPIFMPTAVVRPQQGGSWLSQTSAVVRGTWSVRLGRPQRGSATQLMRHAHALWGVEAMDGAR